MNNIIKKLDKLIPSPQIELDYNKDYELLIATILSAQCTDVRVNKVTKVLFEKYDIYTLAKEDQKIIENIIRPVGSYTRKAEFIIKTSKMLIKDFNGKVPNDRTYLENLPGVGRKTASVVLKNLFNEPAIAVDTHVARVSKRLGLAEKNDSPYIIEQKLIKIIPREQLSKVGDQILLFGRYYCKSRRPLCENCILRKECKKPLY